MLTTKFDFVDSPEAAVVLAAVPPPCAATICRTMLSTMERSSCEVALILLIGPSSSLFPRLRHHQLDFLCRQSFAPFCCDLLIGHQHVNLAQVAQVGQACVAELRAVGDDDHFLGARHHGPLCFDQEQVAVVATPLVDPGYAKHGSADI